MEIIVVGSGVIGITTTHSLFKQGYKVTLIDEASSPCQGSSFAMNGFMGARSANMLCTPFKGKAGLASIFAKTRRVSWDVSLGHMRFLRQLAAARGNDSWTSDRLALVSLARYSVGLTEFLSRIEDLNYEQVLGLMQVFTNGVSWEEAHKDQDAWTGGVWGSPEETVKIDPALEKVPGMIGSFYMPQELSGNGSYFSKQLQALNAKNSDLTLMYHTKVLSLTRDEEGKITGVKTDKGEVVGDAVVLCNNVGAVPLIQDFIQIPTEVLTGWTVTANIDVMGNPPRHTVNFVNKDVLVTRLGNRLRVSGRFWIGEVTHDMSEKVPNELYMAACELLPDGAVWKDSTNWEGKVLITPDSLPIVGSTPVKGLYLNICHGLNGWTLAVGCADLIRAAIAEEMPPIDQTPYLLSRFKK